MVDGAGRELVFVYGSLRKGGGLHHYLVDSTFLGEGTIEGQLFHCGGWFPAVKHGEGRVFGEVYMITADVLAQLDRAEGHPGFYKRELTLVELEEEFVTTWVYFGDRINTGDRIESGDWNEAEATRRANS